MRQCCSLVQDEWRCVASTGRVHPGSATRCVHRRCIASADVALGRSDAREQTGTKAHEPMLAENCGTEGQLRYTRPGGNRLAVKNTPAWNRPPRKIMCLHCSFSRPCYAQNSSTLVAMWVLAVEVGTHGPLTYPVLDAETITSDTCTAIDLLCHLKSIWPGNAVALLVVAQRNARHRRCYAGSRRVFYVQHRHPDHTKSRFCTQ